MVFFSLFTLIYIIRNLHLRLHFAITKLKTIKFILVIM